MVVVAVDPRWLLYSVRAAFGGVPRRRGRRLADRGGARDWRSTPLNYLEKIFQIPFTLQPMRVDGFERLIEQLASPLEEESDRERASTSTARRRRAAEAARREPVGATPGGSGQASTDQATDRSADANAASDAGRDATRESADTSQSANPPLTTQHLDLLDHEQAFMKRLHELIPSPRAAKRFVNVYRLLKAKAELDDETFAQLVRPPETGDYRAVLLLLAILIGHPAEATEILSTLAEERPTGDWWPFLEQFRSRTIAPKVTSGDRENRSGRRARRSNEPADDSTNGTAGQPAPRRTRRRWRPTGRTCSRRSTGSRTRRTASRCCRSISPAGRSSTGRWKWRATRSSRAASSSAREARAQERRGQSAREQGRAKQHAPAVCRPRSSHSGGFARRAASPGAVHLADERAAPVPEIPDRRG